MDDLMVLSLTSAPFISRIGFVFEGWYLDAAFTQKVTYPYSVDAAVTFYALWRAAGVTFTLNAAGTGYIVTKNASDPQAVIVIPETYRNLPVVEIAANAFENDYILTQITIPKTVLLIGSRAFYNCNRLFSIEILNNQQYLNVGADWHETFTETDIYFALD
jgi:uncharacterized repeat protein (TIGR02543 family)